MRLPLAICAMWAAAIAGCAPKPMTAADVTRYTSLRICGGGAVRDLTTPEERDTTPGFSFHVDLVLPPGCKEDFERQLAAFDTRECTDLAKGVACVIEDASVHGATKKHTTIVASPRGGSHYDLRFFE